MEESKLVKKMKWFLWLLGFVRIPLIGFVRPKIITLNDDRVEVKIKLRRRTKNHLNSMYFGALAVGADIAGGIHAFYFSKKLGYSVSFAFKGIQGEFLKRAVSDVLFVCNDGLLIQNAIIQSKESGERMNQEVVINALNTDGEKVAIFKLIASVKYV